LSKDEEREVCKFAEVSKIVMQNAAQDVITIANGQPILNSKSSDGTPTSIVKRMVARMQGTKTERWGRESCEFLVKNQFLRTVSAAGVPTTRCILQDPVKLQFGKSAHAIFQCCIRDWSTLRQLGHAGLALEHYSNDRCGATALERIFKGYHALHRSAYNTLCKTKSYSVFENMEFTMFTCCGLHDASNALKWGVMTRFDESEVLKDVYIVCEALRHATDVIRNHILPWAVHSTVFEEPCEETANQLYDVYRALSIDEPLAKHLAFTLQLRCRDRELVCASTCRDMVGFWDNLTNTLMSLWRFRRWVEGRFLNVGKTSRVLTAGFLTGLDAFHLYLEEHGLGKEYLLNGYRRCKGDRRLFIVIVAVVSKVAEGVIAALMEDPRAVRNYQKLWERIARDMLFVVSIQDRVWHTLAAVCDVHADSLRSQCISAAHVVFHFFWRRLLQPLTLRPWCLALGRIGDNLRQLEAEEEAPDDQTTFQLWVLLRSGYPFNELLKLVELFREIPFTTLAAEQQHGVFSALHRFHPDYSENMLTARAMLSTTWRMFPKTSLLEKRRARLGLKRCKLKRKQPNKISGRHMYVKELFGLCIARRGKFNSRSGVRKLMKGHGACWKLRPFQERQQWHLKARIMAASRRAALCKETADINATMVTLDADIMAKATADKPMLMSESVFEEKHLQLMVDLCAGDDLTETRIEVLRAKALDCPPPAEPCYRQRLDNAGGIGEPQHDIPEWAASIIARRDAFRDCGIVVVHNGERLYFKILYAIQQPRYLALARLQVAQHYHTMPRVTLANWLSLHMDVTRHSFTCNFADHYSHGDVPPVSSASVLVMPDLEHLGGTTVISRQSSIPLIQYVALAPEPTRNSTNTGENPPKSKKKSLLEQFPWLDTYERKLDFYASHDRKKKKASAPESDDESDKDSLNEEDVAAALEELHAARAEILLDADGFEFTDFHTRVLGGRKDDPRSFDAVQGIPCTEDAAEFSRRRTGQASMRFSIAYGLQVCGVLARAWCHRLQHFYNLESSDALGAAMIYTAEHFADYTEPRELLQLAETSTSGEVLGRIRQIRALLV
jgi:hypothetical protein